VTKVIYSENLGENTHFYAFIQGQMTLMASTVATATFEAVNGARLEITGSELEFDDDGNPVGGTAMSATFYDADGNQLIEFTEFSVSASLLFQNTDQHGWFIDETTLEKGFAGSLLDGDDVLTGSAIGDRMTGLWGNDTIDGLGGNDFIFAYDGDDTIDGAEGNDYIEAGIGNDEVLGGAGDDVIYAYDGDDAIDGGTGSDEISGGEGKDTLKGGLDNDSLWGFTGDDVIFGDAGNDILYGWDDNDKLNGGGGKDILYGDAGNDSLVGGGGSDLLDGGTGKDRLDGGAGKDELYAGGGETLKGGSGADTFYFTIHFLKAPQSTVFNNRDVVEDFSRKQKDRLDVNIMDANDNSDGSQNFTFIGTNDFHKKAGELRYETKKNDTFIYGDTDGDGKPNFVIELDGHFKLTGQDFIL
jgi:Ca2+-binding RTX toxin-like protein